MDVILETPEQRSYALTKVVQLKEELRSQNLKVSVISSELKARLRNDDRRKKKKMSPGTPTRGVLPSTEPPPITYPSSTTELEMKIKLPITPDELMSSPQQERRMKRPLRS